MSNINDIFYLFHTLAKNSAIPGQIPKLKTYHLWLGLSENKITTGCFRYIEENNTQLANAERVKFCKNDSPYLPIIRQFFELEEDWMPWPKRN